MWEKFIGKKCKVKTVSYDSSIHMCVYEGVITGIDDELIEMELEKVGQDLIVKSCKLQGTTLIRKTYVISISIVE